jgi:hypothetical protein
LTTNNALGIRGVGGDEGKRKRCRAGPGAPLTLTAYGWRVANVSLVSLRRSGGTREVVRPRGLHVVVRVLARKTKLG